MVRRQHTLNYLALVEILAPKFPGLDETVPFQRLEREHDDLRAALHMDPLRGLGQVGRVLYAVHEQRQPRLVGGRLHTVCWHDAATGERPACVEIVLDDRILLDPRGGARGAATDDTDGVAFQAPAWRGPVVARPGRRGSPPTSNATR